jgi:SpoVK/Ycf46/Vps4 family AAA+-type ATPase
MDPFTEIQHHQHQQQHHHRRSSTLLREGRQPQDKNSILLRRLSIQPSLHPNHPQNPSVLGEKWTQMHGSGSLTRAGTHFCLQSYQQMYLVLSTSVKRPIIEVKNNHYDLELSLKFGKPAFFASFVFGYDGEKFYTCVGNIKNRTWSLNVHYVDRENRKISKTALQTVQMNKNVKPHLFCNMYLQVRGSEISLDADNKPVFTSLTLKDGCTGEVGVVSMHNTSMVFKKFRMIRKNLALSAPPAPPAPQTSPSLPSKPIVNLGDPKLVELIERDLINSNSSNQPQIQYNSIAGHDEAKRLLQEAIIMPMLVPELFNGIRQPWKGVLLFGPPGTGKTMLAKATAAVAGINFFNTSAASLVSKYHGESEKLVKTLFNVARHWSPSVVFIDEVDALVKSRGPNEHEGSRRLKSEFLTQMDGMTSSSTDSNVLVLATTNCPWDLDEALLRRFEKRIYVPLPNDNTKMLLFQMLLQDVHVEEQVKSFLYPLVKRTKHFSGADIRLLVREAAMGPMRRMLLNKTSSDISEMRKMGILDVGSIQLDDFIRALKKTNSSVDISKISKFDNWNKSYGSQ